METFCCTRGNLCVTSFDLSSLLFLVTLIKPVVRVLMTSNVAQEAQRGVAVD